MNCVFEKACAKINICLDVVGIREDSYHSIESIMLCTTLADDVTVSEVASAGITLECSDKNLPTDEKNLAYKAALEFFDYIDETPHVHISIVKRIPDRAGLAGGSADAAAVLRALNVLSGRNFSDEELRKIAEKIGSDVIFCVSSDPSFVSGRGEVIDYCPSLPECTVLIAKGESGVRTPSAYRALDEIHGDYSGRGGKASLCFDAICSGDLEKIAEAAFNIFEDVVIPYDGTVAEIKKIMSGCGASLSLMSGSGSAVFGLFKEKAGAERAYGILTESGFFSYICRPL